jgi:hypothetical protein
MTFLPIVERELRVAARKAGTYWLRVLAALVVLVIAGGVLLVSQLQRGMFGLQTGAVLFAILKYLAFLFTATAGVFLTADCLSEEKRDGTLGLLFLTDLRGHDVVLGKLLATSLRAAYGLLAVFPIMGLAFLMGGVSGGEFWRLMLVLCNTLFFSLATGLLVSSLSREGLKAMTGTVLLGAVFVLLLPALEEAVSSRTSVWHLFFSRLSLASPTSGLNQSSVGSSADFWWNAAVVHGLAWGLLAAASFFAPRSWQQKPRKSLLATPGAAPAARAKPRAGRTARRDPWLERNPVGWLAVRERWLMGAVRVLVFGGAGLFAVLIAVGGRNGAANPAGLAFAYGGLALFYGLALLFELWLAAQASRFFTEGRRSGLLELLLATPITSAEIVQGQWWALRRLFLLPALVLLVMLALSGAMQVVTMGSLGMPNNGPFLAFQIVTQIFGLIKFVTGLWALAWFGMWMGLTSRTATLAVIKTVVFAKVLPWMALTFGQGIFMVAVSAALARTSGGGLWAAPLIGGLLAVGINIGFVIVSRQQVGTHFREYAAQGSGPMLQLKPAPPLLPR